MSKTPKESEEVRLWNTILDHELASQKAANFSMIRLRRKILPDLGITWDVALAYLTEWADKEWWDYGIDIEYGWLTARGLARGRL